MRKVVINGKFLSQNITGVQRYAREILFELDKISDEDMEIILAVEKSSVNIPEYRSIKVQPTGRLKGNLWEQISLPLYVKKHNALCVSLCNMAPLLTPHVVVLHDISFKVNKRFFSRQFTLWYNFVFNTIIHRIQKLITVSQFSRSEIAREYGIPPEEIVVTYNGWQHFDRVGYNESTLERNGLTPQGYCFAMSSLTPNKNFRWIAENARCNPGMTYVVGGGINEKIFGDVFDFEVPKNMKFLGYVSDEEAKTLMRDCCLFLFPTFYEGFGIPPLEAICSGARVAVSDTDCMREIYSDNAVYIDPNKPDVDIMKLIASSPKPDRSLMEKYSWAKSAEILHDTIKTLI